MRVWLVSLWLLLPSLVSAEDEGKNEVALLSTVLLFGSNAESEANGGVPKAETGHVERLSKVTGLKYSHYQKLGEDVQPIWRSYTNWASPMKGSEEILLSFEPNSEPGERGLRLDLELWVSRRKIMKSTQVLQHHKWLYISGPKWRGGQLIIGVELLEPQQRAQ
ncbi:MAG: hypothetical protein Q7Q71_10520 [Verrucomicrobiota bacterium JB023]|nr:hypothetical protein [Verrucomicrobiota bacterium JB023]